MVIFGSFHTSGELTQTKWLIQEQSGKYVFDIRKGNPFKNVVKSPTEIDILPFLYHGGTKGHRRGKVSYDTYTICIVKNINFGDFLV